jgi:hypothetical protein
LTTALAAVGSDPWLDLDPLRSPAEADRYAREHSGRLDAQDPRRVAGLVSWLVRRAALDGSTVVSVDVVSAVLRGYEVLDPAAGAELALRESRVAAFADDRLLGHPSESVAEERVADSLVALVTEGSVASGAGISAAELTERVVASPLTVAEVPRGGGCCVRLSRSPRTRRATPGPPLPMWTSIATISHPPTSWSSTMPNSCRSATVPGCWSA